MTALVHSFPQQSSTVTMLQTRHDSASSGPFLTSSQSQQQLRNSQLAKGIYGGSSRVTSYRGHASIPPVAPYAFTATPVVPAAGNPLRQHPTTPHLRQESRTISAPVITLSQQNALGGSTKQSKQTLAGNSPTIVPVQDTPNPVATHLRAGTRDDSSIASPRTTAPRPMSAMELNLSDTKLSAMGTIPKPSPDRYRRIQRRSEAPQSTFSSSQIGGSAMPSGSGMATVGHLYNQPAQYAPSLNHQQPTYRGMPMLHTTENVSPFAPQPRLVSKDDMVLNRQTSSEQAKRYRRRSVGGLAVGDYTGSVINSQEQSVPLGQPKTYASVVAAPLVLEEQFVRPFLPIAATIRSVSHGRNGSDESASSFNSVSRPSSV